MKKTIKTFVAIAAAIATLVSCAKETPASSIDDEQLIEVTLIAGNPEMQPSSPTSKTIMVGSSPKWCDGDKIGVSNGTSTNYIFSENSISDGKPADIAEFTGSTTVSGTLYAYSPYSGIGVSANGAKVDIPANQNPTATSFDGAADIMVAKSFTVDPASTTVEDLQFARLGAIVKLVLTDSKSTMVGTQHPTTVSMTAASDLVGRVYIDMVNQCINETEGVYFGGSHTVTAHYTSETKYAINGSNATYLIVYPQTLAAGSTLTITASTEDYAIEKEITVPAGGIELLPGKITTLNISLLASHITEDTGAALPFNDDMAWANADPESSTNIASSVATESSGLYTAATNIYKSVGKLKLGKNGENGSITTKELNLTGAFYILIESGKYGSDTGTLEVSIDGDDVITGGSMSGTNYVNISAGTYTKKSKVTIATSANRGYIYSVDIESGTYVAPPVINVTSENPMAISNANDLHAITYTISNPTGASVSASANVAWIHDFDYSVDGEVSFEVDAQEENASARNGVITLSYTGATNVPVTINQAAGPTSGPSLQTLYSESFGSNGSNVVLASHSDYSATASMFTDPLNTVVSHYTSDGKVGKNTTNPSSGYTGASGNSAMWYTGTKNSDLTINLFTVDKINISNATGLSVSFGLYYKDGVIGTSNTVTVYYKIDSGAEQTLSFSQPSTGSWDLCSGSISGTGNSLKIRFEMHVTGGYTARVDDIKVVGTK